MLVTNSSYFSLNILHPETIFLIWASYDMSSADALSLDWSKILSNGKELTLNSLPNDKILDWSKFKALADDKIM